MKKSKWLSVLICMSFAAVLFLPGLLIRNHPDPNFGFNASTEQYEDLVAAGVIDPTKVTRTALQNAASIASLMLTTEAMICAVVEEPGE